METKNIFFHEAQIGDTITYNAIYPKTIKVESKQYADGQSDLIINGVGFATYGSAKLIINSTPYTN